MFAIGDRVVDESWKRQSPKRGSEKRYQIAAWVSAIAMIIRNQSEENSQTSLHDSDRSLQRMARGHT